MFACNGTKKTTSSDGEVTSVWVNSNLHEAVTIHDEVGVATFGECFSISESEKLNVDEMGMIQTKWKPLCGEIQGFDFEEGYIYRLKIKRTETNELFEKHNVMAGTWELIEQLSKEKDIFYKRREVKTVWIGPKKIKVRCGSPMAPPDCKELRHQAQFSENYDLKGEWEPLYDIFTFPAFTKGNIYQIRYTKVYLSEWEQDHIADHPGYDSENIEVIMKVEN